MMSVARILRIVGVAGVTTTAAMLLTPAQAHHSFAMYDRDVVRVFTGVVTRVEPDANHQRINFVPMNEKRDGVIRDSNGDPQIWVVEMGPAVASAREGITVNSFPSGTIFSVGLHPLRSGDHVGGRIGALIRCPDDTPPPAGRHCDVVEGSTSHGSARGLEGLPEPSDDEGS